MKTYVINLKVSTDRKAYMETILAHHKCLDVEFIEAVNGKEMSEEERNTVFDQKKAYEHYGRELRPGEIGCTMSHKKCARLLLDSTEPFALFLEDDLIWRAENLAEIFQPLENILNTNEPRIILLSGDYWYRKLLPLEGKYKLADVVDAVCTQSYLINRAAAVKLLALGNWHLADDWWAIRKFGIKLMALHPHVADQNRADVDTVIAQVYGGLKRENLTFPVKMQTYWRSLVDKMLVKSGRFEEKNFKWKQ